VYLTQFSSVLSSMSFHGLMTLVALMVATIMLRLIAAPSKLASVLLENTAVVGLGRISYGLYLYHMLVIYWMDADSKLGWKHPGHTLLIATLSVTAAVASYWIVERPFLRIKDRLNHPQGAGAAGSVPATRAAA
jgi:peptidoglycan/LPS O-acetylase OafA/YrhL